MNALFDHTKYATKKELFAFLVENKAKLIAQKKATTKHADGFSFNGTAPKAATKSDGERSEIQVKAVINTTNLMDSHSDVHLPGIWDKSLRENKMIMHIREHKMAFDSIISDGDDLKASAKTYTWKELGFDLEGKTQALVFDSTIKQDRNLFMFNQYMKGQVKNHSVGMRYVKLILAVNDEDYGAEFEAWQKYYPMVANKETADAAGYFWAVREAKVIEGSAVPIGSNYATPTLEIKEPMRITPKNEPLKGTQKISTFLFT